MIDPEAFDDLIGEVARLNNLDVETAGDVVVAVGDTPAVDRATGKFVAELADGRRLLIDWPEDVE